MNVCDLIDSLRRYNPDATVDVYATGIPNSGLVDLDINGIFGPEDAATIHAYVSDRADSSTHGHGTASPSRTSPTPPPPAAPTHRKTAQDELGLHCAHYGDRHIDVASVHAILEIAEQLRIHNLIALANGQLPERILDDPGYTDIQATATKALVDIETHAVDVGLPVPGECVTAQLRPDIAAALGIEPLDEQEQQ